MPIHPAPCLALALLAGAPCAQSVLFTTVNGAHSIIGGKSELLELRGGEVAALDPLAIGALPFLSAPAQWALLGDADYDTVYVENGFDGPCGHIDALDVLTFTEGHPAQLLISASDPQGFGPGVHDGDVLRYRGPSGGFEVYLPEWMLSVALCHQGFADVDLDAFCRTAAGDFLFSLREAVPLPSHGTIAEPGDLLFLPAGAFFTGAEGQLLGVTSCSANIVARRADFQAWVDASGMRDAQGGLPVFDDLTALALDPAGGSFDSPSLPGALVPHLLFAWGNDTNDGAVISTRNGGELGEVDGYRLAFDTATTGRHLGLKAPASGVGGLNALALAPSAAALPVAECNLGMYAPAVGQGIVIDVAGGTPRKWFALLGTVGPSGPGELLQTYSVSGFSGFELYGSPSKSFLFGVEPISASGFSRFHLPALASAPAGVHLALQPVELFGHRIGSPALLVFP